MNSIEDLNITTNQVEYTDPRPSAVIFNRGTALNGTQTALEGQSLTAYYGIDIIDIINYDQALPTFTIDVSDNEFCSVTWDEFPDHCIVTNSEPGIYVVSGIRSVGDWDLIKNANILLPFDYSGEFTYSCNIQSTVSSIKSWTVSVDITDVIEWNTIAPADYWYPVGTAAVQNVPQLIDAANPIESWYCLITPSDTSAVYSFNTSGNGGTTSFNPTSKQLTINGTNAQINNHLASLTMTTDGAGEAFFTVQYRVTNLITGQSDNIVQNLKPASIRYLSSAGAFGYTEDTQFNLSPYPQITHTEAVGGENYILTITPNNSSAIRTMTTAGTGGTTAFNSSTKVTTLTGNKTQINSHLATITIQPGQDFDVNFTLNYFISISPTGFNQNKVQAINIANAHNEISNINLTRNFINGINALLFPNNVPQITDLDPNPGNYTITLSVPTSTGTFSAPGTSTSRTWTYTGSKSDVNTKLAAITFNPGTNYFSNTIVTYIQNKPGINQANTTFFLDGPDVAFTSTTTTNPTQTVIEGSSFAAVVGNNILGVNDYGTTAPTYTINVSAVPGATVTWPTIPNGCIVTNPSTGVYRISGISGSSIWNQIRYPNINLPSYYDGTFAYTGTIHWNNFSNSLGWSVTTTVTNVELLSAVTSMNFYSGQTYALSGYPQIVDAGLDLPTSYTVTITPNSTTAVTSMTSPNGSFDAVSKVLTIQGAASIVNAELASITIIPAATYGSNISLTYYATNNNNAETGTRIQTLTKLADANFDTLTPSTQTRSTTEGGTFVHPAAANITFINTYASPLPSYTIDLTNAPGSTVTWYSPLPSGVTASVPSPNVYKLSGIDTVAKWNLIKTPTINMNNFTSGTFGYTASIGYGQGQSVSWTTNTTIPDVDLLTNVSEFGFYDNTQYIWGYPQLVDTGIENPTYTVTVTPSVTGVINTLSCTNGTFNNSTKVLTITGTLSQINAGLNAIAITFNSIAVSTEFTFTYLASNNVNPETSTKIQNARYGTTNLGITRTYLSNQKNLIFLSNTPQILDDGQDGNYSLTLTAASGYFLDNTYDLNNRTDSAYTNTITITGNRSEINSRLAQMAYAPPANYTSNTTFTVLQTKNSITQVNKTFSLNYAGAGSANLGTRLYTFNNNDWFVPPVEYYLYGGKVDYLIVGGGGGAGYGPILDANPASQTEYCTGGGGGGGQVTFTTNASITKSIYRITVGSAGKNAYSTGSTQINATGGGTSNLDTVAGASGGNPGNVYTTTADGGSSGSGRSGGSGKPYGQESNVGSAAGALFDKWYGGGGGGSASNGGNWGYIPPSSGTYGYYKTGDGGAGTANNITGTSIIYGAGGYGGSLFSNGGVTPNSQIGTSQASSDKPGSGGNGAYWGGSDVGPGTEPGAGIIILKLHS